MTLWQQPAIKPTKPRKKSVPKPPKQPKTPKIKTPRKKKDPTVTTSSTMQSQPPALPSIFPDLTTSTPQNAFSWSQSQPSIPPPPQTGGGLSLNHPGYYGNGYSYPQNPGYSMQPYGNYGHSPFQQSQMNPNFRGYYPNAQYMTPSTYQPTAAASNGFNHSNGLPNPGQPQIPTTYPTPNPGSYSQQYAGFRQFNGSPTDLTANYYRQSSLAPFFNQNQSSFPDPNGIEVSDSESDSDDLLE